MPGQEKMGGKGAMRSGILEIPVDFDLSKHINDLPPVVITNILESEDEFEEWLERGLLERETWEDYDRRMGELVHAIGSSNRFMINLDLRADELLSFYEEHGVEDTPRNRVNCYLACFEYMKIVCGPKIDSLLGDIIKGPGTNAVLYFKSAMHKNVLKTGVLNGRMAAGDEYYLRELLTDALYTFQAADDFLFAEYIPRDRMRAFLLGGGGYRELKGPSKLDAIDRLKLTRVFVTF